MMKSKEQLASEAAAKYCTCGMAEGDCVHKNTYIKAFLSGFDAACEWVSVETALPEQYADCLFVVKSRDTSINGRVLGGRYTGEWGHKGFSIPGVVYQASHWMPSPQPPLPTPPTQQP